LHYTLVCVLSRKLLEWSALSADQPGGNMAQNHYTSKTKRRQKNSKRKDPSAATMAAMRQLEANAKKPASKQS